VGRSALETPFNELAAIRALSAAALSFERPWARPARLCGLWWRVRAVGQLRAYFASAERLARSLDIGSVAALAREAAALIEREASR